MVLLSAQTSLRRATIGVTHGDAGDETLRRRIRAHGNFIENAPLAIVVLAMVELSGAARTNVVILALLFLFARMIHAAGMLYTSGPALRAIGMFLQHAAFLFGAVVLINRVMHAA
jgi:uncharacterized membrane protein YecN with MAPEG domain